MYSNERTPTMVLAGMAQLMSCTPLGIDRPLPVETVADAAVAGCSDREARGIHTIDDIERLAKRVHLQ